MGRLAPLELLFVRPRSLLAKAALLIQLLHVAVAGHGVGESGHRVSLIEQEVHGARDGSDPGWKAAVAEANEVSRLSDEIERTEMMIEEWRRKHEQARQFHEEQKKLIKKQIELRKQQQGLQNEELDNYEQQQEEHYTYMMCSLLLDGFFFDKDKDKRIHILHLCMGRKSLALVSHPTRRLKRGPHRKGHRTWDDKMLLALGRGLRRISHEVDALVVAEREIEQRFGRGPVENMRRRLNRLKDELRQVRAQYHEDSARWRAERAELNKEENSHGDTVNNNWQTKQAMKKRAWAKVKGNFCPVINANYGIDEQKIVDHALQECQGPET